jgi:hypothetical protein
MESFVILASLYLLATSLQWPTSISSGVAHPVNVRKMAPLNMKIMTFKITVWFLSVFFRFRQATDYSTFGAYGLAGRTR